jgi:hypothetical protein
LAAPIISIRRNTVKIVNVPKRKLVFAALAVVALVGVVLIVLDIEASSGDGKIDAATDGLLSSADITLTKAEVEDATTTAGHALSEVMRLDHAEGKEAWETRIKPLCTENGLAFWTGPLFADQIWPTVIQREYTTQEIKVVDAHVIGEGDLPGSIVVEVTLNLTYMLGKGDESIQEQKTNQIVMVKNPGSGPGFFQGKSPDGLFPVQQDGQWLTDGPPAPSYWSSEE